MSLVVATEPTSLVAVEDQCLRVEMWAESATSIPELERLERITADDRFPANREQVAAALRGHLTYATEVMPDLLRGLDTDPTEDR